MRYVIDVEVVEKKTPRERAKAWVAALWWPVLLVAQVVLVVTSTKVRHIDDGLSTLTMRFGSPWDLAYLLFLTGALTLEARRLVVILFRWWRLR